MSTLKRIRNDPKPFIYGGVVYTEGDPVIITAKDFFEGKKAAVVTEACLYHDNSVECLLLDKIVTFRTVCVCPERGDTIARI